MKGGVCVSDALTEKQKQIESAMRQALKYLVKREYTLSDMQARLLGKGYSDDVVQNAIESLLQEGHLSQSRFIEQYIASRISRGDGPIKIRRDLMMKGCSSEEIDEYLDDGAHYWKQHAQALLDKKARVGEGDDSMRSYRLLKRKGYSDAVARALLLSESV